MKKFTLFVAVFFLVFSSSFAFAIPQLIPGPLYIQFSGLEQISPTNSIEDPEGNFESSWGIFRVSNIYDGATENNPQNFDQGTTPIWNNSEFEHITGIFFGTQIVEGPQLNSSDGEIHFYWNPGLDKGILNNALPTGRTATDKYTGFTEGVFLGGFSFVNGAILAGRPDVSVTGTSIPTGVDDFSGFADSFGNVLDYNGDGIIDGGDGFWASALNSNYFNTELGANTADVKFRNVYDGNLNHSWNGLDNSGIFGAGFSDPLRANVVPEPSTFILLGAGFLGLAALGRKRNNN